MNKRQDNLNTLEKEHFDVLIIGAGINGAVAAASLAARGIKVALIDKNDFSSGSSSQSSCLVWGGIKYLESHEYLLVNKLCKGRNNLIRHYPSAVKEIRFLTTIQKGFRFPVWFVFLGTVFYWGIGRFFTQAPKYYLSKQIKKQEPCINTDNAQGGFEYSDAFLLDNDARFVFNHIQHAIQAGAVVANYTESLGSQREGKDNWLTQVKDKESGRTISIRSKAIINACGPWVDQHNKLSKQSTSHHHVFSKGIHLIVDRIPQKDRVLAFFASDGRLFFMIPMGDKTCIGTTDTQVKTPETSVSVEDRTFVLKNANALLDLPARITEDDIISERCGVRPLAIEAEDGKADWVQLSRKHQIDINAEAQHISIFGGKLTDCVNVGEEIAEAIEDIGIQLKSLEKPWYGEPDLSSKQQYLKAFSELDSLTHQYSDSPLTERCWRRYGKDAFTLMQNIKAHPEKAKAAIEHTAFTWAEIEWIAENEMIVELEDLFRRRSKTGLVVKKEVLINAKGFTDVCQFLFPENYQEKMEKFIRSA